MRKLESPKKKQKLYGVWRSMLTRCYSPTHQAYQRYGARGIQVSREWDTYEAFKEWAENNGYCVGLSIDRIDNDCDYSPANCRWVDQKTQNNNKSDNIIVQIGDKCQTLMQWVEESDMNYSTVWWRIRRGWSPEKAITTPKKWERRSSHS